MAGAAQRSPLRLRCEEWGNLGSLELDPEIPENSQGLRLRTSDIAAPPGALGFAQRNGVYFWTDTDMFGRGARELADISVHRHEQTPWFELALSADALARHDDKRIRLMFESAYMHAARPPGMTLWFAANADGGAHMYMSPVSAAPAAAVVERFRATPCRAPSQPLVLIAGDRDASSHPDDSPSHRRPLAKPCLRSYLPVAYACRTVTALEDAPGKFAMHQLRPFVQRFSTAWFTSRSGAQILIRGR
ncbi:hypothetical protein [Salinisphaera aquimarina]|uniref:Uncharacterized protein n=1 Tax=Salinisphaera aquimarina TaxID=2094031 RepID=A0ABV7EP89_9GAMM